MIRALALAAVLALSASCRPAEPAKAAAVAPSPYRWTQATADAGFPGSYNFPVFLAQGRAWARHPAGTWSSADGTAWRKEALPASGTNTAYLKEVQLGEAVYALGRIEGNYLGFTITPSIRRTSDFKTWETLGASSTLPRRVFYGAVAFKGAIWIVGGFDGQRSRNEVFRSTDGLTWTQVEAPPWGPRVNPHLVVLKDRLWLIGGGEIDGPAQNDVWVSDDARHWTKVADGVATPEPVGYTAAAFDGRLWLVGANRSGGFSSEMLVSDDGKTWTALSAPWTPRGGVAVWDWNGAMWITGGKYSTGSPPDIRFVYSHDVWAMRRP
ncbi:hypothetical protein QO010_000556 [Caulobacter ginsengisoli]|uniref:Galactose oxidase n=1 Tax=Caulobacter ginsengisoli TaxID=400775 RepID=A0ABU0INQ9_9CAUL|nr:hypothetical protein [Caulobacter ginsengisoli]MDQ0462808.1 hypothetical protein [Caulobacter ginsengisoli]